MPVTKGNVTARNDDQHYFSSDLSRSVQPHEAVRSERSDELEIDPDREHLVSEHYFHSELGPDQRELL
jgi:hypothetical protein